MSVLGNRFLNGLGTEGIRRDKTDQHGVCPCLPSPLMAPCSEGDSIFSKLGSSVDSCHSVSLALGQSEDEVAACLQQPPDGSLPHEPLSFLNVFMNIANIGENISKNIPQPV